MEGVVRVCYKVVCLHILRNEGRYETVIMNNNMKMKTKKMMVVGLSPVSEIWVIAFLSRHIQNSLYHFLFIVEDIRYR